VQTWAISWDDRGLDAVICFYDVECRRVMEVLADGDSRTVPMNALRELQLRSQRNRHLNYEIWLVDAGENFTEDTFRNYFNLDEAAFKATVRKHGLKQFE
jgi:hypothetical protein